MKKAFGFAVSTMFVTSLALAGNDPDFRDNKDAGSESTVSAYSSAALGSGDVLKVAGCPGKTKMFLGKSVGTVYDYPVCGGPFRDWMKNNWCKTNKGKKWYYRIGNSKKTTANTCR